MIDNMDYFLKTVSAVNNDTRVIILRYILQYGESCVCELETSLEMTQSRLSINLKILKDAEFLDVKREGKWAYYKIGSLSPLQKSILDEISKIPRDFPKKTESCTN